MKDKAFEKVTEYIDAMAAKLGVAAEHVYGILVKQQIAEGITYVIVMPLILAVLAFVLTKLIKSLKSYEGYDPEGYIAGIAISGLALLIVFVVAIFVVPEAILKISNPEYYAIRELLDAVGGAK
jgi:hypothetical protein